MHPVHLCAQLPATATRAMLSPNKARNHHYISQTEQRQHAFNPDVNANNQNVYRLTKQAWHNPRALCQSVNIDHNLAANNLYTLSELDDGEQYNMENWFVRYEGRYERDCDALKALSLGHHAMSAQVLRVLKLKWLSLLRNPLNHHHFIVRHLSQAWQQGLRYYAQTLQPRILQRDAVARARLAQQFDLSDEVYIAWLSFLYALLSDAVAMPSWFERISHSLIAHPEVKIQLFQDAAKATVFADTGFALQTSSQHISIGFSIAPHHFAICHIPQQHWRNLAACWCAADVDSDNIAHATMTVLPASAEQASLFNALMQRSASQYLYSRADQRSLLA